jgi:hypothetical protein
VSFRDVSVIEVREVLRAWLAGAGLRTVAVQAGVDRKTIDYRCTSENFEARFERRVPTLSCESNGHLRDTTTSGPDADGDGFRIVAIEPRIRKIKCCIAE